MPGHTDTYGFPYPLLGEVVDATSWHNLALAIDAEATNLQTLQQSTVNRPRLWATNVTSATITSGNDYQVPSWVTQYAIPAASFSITGGQITVGAGLYLVQASVLCQFATTLTSVTATITTSASPVAVLRMSQVPGNSQLFWTTNVYGLVHMPTNGNPIGVQARATGTGTGTFSSATITISKLSNV